MTDTTARAITPETPIRHGHKNGLEHEHGGRAGFTIGGQIIPDTFGDSPHAHGTMSIGAGPAAQITSGDITWSDRDNELCPHGEQPALPEPPRTRLDCSTCQKEVGAEAVKVDPRDAEYYAEHTMQVDDDAPLPIDATPPITLEQRIQSATEDAEDAFWAVVAGAFPEAEHGDMDPLEVMRLEEHLTRAVREWVEENVPGARKDGD